MLAYESFFSIKWALYSTKHLGSFVKANKKVFLLKNFDNSIVMVGLPPRPKGRFATTLGTRAPAFPGTPLA